jgi:hypothetical protein
MHIDDAAYFRSRALQEQVAAQRSTCEAARESHNALAVMYRFRAMMTPGAPAFEPDPPRRTIAEPLG